MTNHSNITLGELISHGNAIIQRNAMSILKQLQREPKKYPKNGMTNGHMFGTVTGEYREPRQGEWYVSGAIPECYRAPHNLRTKYHIVTEPK